MKSTPFTESTVEQAALAWLEALGYAIVSGLDIAPGEAAAEWIAERVTSCRSYITQGVFRRRR